MTNLLLCLYCSFTINILLLVLLTSLLFVNYVRNNLCWKSQPKIKKIFCEIIEKMTDRKQDNSHTSKLHNLVRMLIEKLKTNKDVGYDAFLVREHDWLGSMSLTVENDEDDVSVSSSDCSGDEDDDDEEWALEPPKKKGHQA